LTAPRSKLCALAASSNVYVNFIARGETEKRIESIKKLVEETSALALLTAKDQSIRTSFQFDLSIDQVVIDRVQIEFVAQSHRGDARIRMPKAVDFQRICRTSNGSGERGR
jgi:hypothetical protein